MIYFYLLKPIFHLFHKYFQTLLIVILIKQVFLKIYFSKTTIKFFLLIKTSLFWCFKNIFEKN
jgi:hypothetical protein